MTGKHKLQWWVPLSYQAEQAKSDLRKIFSPAAVVRIVLAVAAIFVAAAYLLPQWVPGVEFDWTMAFLKCMGFLVVILGMCCALAFIPPKLTVSPTGVLVNQGQHSRFYPYAELAEIRIEDTGTRLPMLLLRMRSQSETKQYPIPPEIVIDDLQRLIDNGRMK